MALDQLAKIAAAEIAFYFPVLIIAFFISLRRGFNRREGWVFLFTFSLVRMVGGCITLASRLEKNAPIGLFIAASIFQGIGLAPLFLATLSFVTTIARYSTSPITRSSQLFRLLRIVLAVGVIFAIVGGTELTPNNDANTRSHGRTFTRVGMVMFLIGYASLAALHIVLWGEVRNIPYNHRKLLTGVSLALPPLLIRIIYGLLNAFSSSFQNRWSPVSGTWWIYLVMGLVMEYLVVCVYVITGILTPLHEDPIPADYGAQSLLPIGK